MKPRRLRSPLAAAVGALLLCGLALLGSGVTAAADEDGAAGHVYVLDNNVGAPNSITAYDRAASGALTPRGSTAIGGSGSLAAFADGTQGSLIRTRDDGRLFAVDAGSDQISVVDVRDGKLVPVAVFGSGGSGPVSLSYLDG